MELWISTDGPAFGALPSLVVAVAEHGLESPSLRKIAAGRGSPTTLANWFGNKRELHRRTLLVLGVKWGHVLTSTLVPVSDQDRAYARLRLAFEEIARADPPVAAVLDELVILEEDIIKWWIGQSHPDRPVDPRTITMLHALLVKLWDDRAHPDARASLTLLEEAINAWQGKPAIEHLYRRRLA